MLSVATLCKIRKPIKSISQLPSLLPTSTLYSNPQLEVMNRTIHSSSCCHYQSHLKPNLSYHSVFFHLKSPANLFRIRIIHALLLVNGYFRTGSTNAVLGSQLVSIYITFDCLREALLVFNHLAQKNNLSWNSILRGLVDVGQFSETIELYHSMLRQGMQPDNYTYPIVLKACAGICALEEGRRIRNAIQFDEVRGNAKPNIFVECAMIDMFAKCGSLDDAKNVFEKMPSKDLISWGAMICGSVQNGDWHEALCLFRRMRLEGLRPDSVIVATILPACGKLRAQLQGRALHGCAVSSGFESDLYVSNALIDMYSKCGETREALCVFHTIFHKDIVSWSSLIAGYTQNGEYHASLEVYHKMRDSGKRTNAVTATNVLAVLANLKQLKMGKEMHNYVIRSGFESDIFVGSALIDMYSNCGSMKQAHSIFEIMLDRDITIWNSIIVGYSLNGDVSSALRMLGRIGESKHRVNSITIVSTLPLCSRIGSLRLGKEIHGLATRSGLGLIVSIGNSLVDMYCKCGNLEKGVLVFHQMKEKDIVTYNTIIAAHGVHGRGEEAFFLFNQMKGMGIQPDKVTFIALLSACSHAGLVDKGWFLFNSMRDDYGILPDIEHYSCMVDLLGKLGHLHEACEFIRRMPVEPEINVLGGLLGACRVHSRVDLAELLGREIFQKNIDDPGHYVLLCNIYASTGKWDDASKIRTMTKQKGLTKKPGSSWIQVGSCVHLFHARDQMHSEFHMIQEVLKCLLLEMKDEGYLQNVEFSLGDLEGDKGLTRFDEEILG